MFGVQECKREGELLPLEPDEIRLSRTALLRAEYSRGTGVTIETLQSEEGPSDWGDWIRGTDCDDVSMKLAPTRVTVTHIASCDPLRPRLVTRIEFEGNIKL